MLGTQLFERHTRSVRLTAAGREAVERSRALLAGAADLVERAAAAREPLSGPLHLGVIPTVAPFLLPRVLPPLRAHYPKLKLFLREDQTARLLERLRGGELDMALIALPYETAEFQVRELFRDEFWFVARQGDPLAKPKSVALEKLDPAEVVLLEEGHCLREHAIAACGGPPEAGRSRIEATSLPTLLQMVEGGLGVTLLPEMALKAGLLNGTNLVARPFSVRVPARTLVLAARPASARTADLDLLAGFIREHAAPRLPGGARRRYHGRTKSRGG